METIVHLFHIGDADEYQRIVALLGEIHHTDYQFTGSHVVDGHPEDKIFTEVLSPQYDVVLLDYHWQGGHAARDILTSARSQGCDTPIIVMTDEMEAEVDREAIGLGASDYLIKGRIDSQLIERTIRYAIERKNAERKLARLAHFDALTNIPNRILFRDRLEHALKLAERGPRTFTLLYLDLDGFKQINDKYGHGTGDLLLQSCAERISKCIRKSDTVARIGGDEFTVLLEQTDSSSHIVRITKKIIRAIQRPHSLNNHEIFVGCSIGIAVYPSAGSDAESLQKHADMAMYQAKQSDSENFHFFTEAMNREASQQSQLIEDLSKAVDKQSFSIQYEPVFNLLSRELAAFKIRTRWRHPQAGWVEGEELMDLADDAGLSGALGYWVIHKMLEQREQLARLPAVKLILPLAVRQLYDLQFIQHIKDQSQLLAQSSIQLTLDIHESILLNHHDLVSNFINDVNAPQITFALSHFGLGQFSLEWLDALPFSQLILANELSVEMVPGRNRPVMSALLALAKSLNKQVIVENIDSAEKWQLFRDLGCQAGCGAYLAEPMSWEAVRERYIGQAAIKKSSGSEHKSLPINQVVEG